MKREKSVPFDALKYLETPGVGRRVEVYRKGEIIFSQGDKCNAVLYLQRGAVKLRIVSSRGKEAIIALLGPHEFFGEGCIAGQPLRGATAVAVEPSSILEIDKREIIRVIHEEPEFSDRFLAHMVKRNVRVEEDLADQLFNSSEKRLARTLLLIARYGKEEQPEKVVAKVSQETLRATTSSAFSRPIAIAFAVLSSVDMGRGPLSFVR